MAFLLPRIGANDLVIARILANVPTVIKQPDYRITGFPEYEDRVGRLPDEQQTMINRIAERIVNSHSEFVSIVAFVITGHADKDLRENNPHRKLGETHVQFEMRISGARANRAREALLAKIRVLSQSKSFPLLEQLQTDPRRSKTVAMGATDLLVEHPHSESERKLNRRVEIFLFSSFVPDPNPTPIPPPATDLAERLTHGVEVLKRRGMPSGDVQTQRMRCIFNKLKDNPNVKDVFVDSHDQQPVRINGKFLDGLQNVILSYGNISKEEFDQFLLHAKDSVLSGSGFATNATDEEVIRAMDGLDRQMQKAIGFIDSHLARFGSAADPTKLRLNNLISGLQNDPDSIYSCR